MCVVFLIKKCNVIVIEEQRVDKALLLIFIRLFLWKKKTDGAKMSAKQLALHRLPPTDAALGLNIMRGHYQAILWYNCISGIIPEKDPCKVKVALI